MSSSEPHATGADPAPKPVFTPVFTVEAIRAVADGASFQRGRVYHREGRVLGLHRLSDDTPSWSATVEGSYEYMVLLRRAPGGVPVGNCSCPAYADMGMWCKHLVAVALAVAAGDDASDDEPPAPTAAAHAAIATEVPRPAPAAPYPRTPPDDRRSKPPTPNHAREFLAVFDAVPTPGAVAPSRTRLQVEFAVHADAYAYAYGRESVLGLSMRLGPKRLYVVTHISNLVEAIARGRRHEFTRLFTYDPAEHAFGPADAAVLAVLGEIVQVREAGTGSRYDLAYAYGQDRALRIPPEAGARLWPLLEAAQALLQVSGTSREPSPLRILEPPLPLEAVVEPDGPDRYALTLSGLGSVRLFPAYGLALADGALYRLEPADVVRLARLQAPPFGRADGGRIVLTARELEHAMVHVVPRLRRLAAVTVAPAVAQRVVEAPLVAHVYVDRDGDALLARAEWHYGDVVLPAHGAGAAEPSETRVVLRDGEGERRVLELLDDGVSPWRDGTVRIEDDDAVYAFLRDTLGALQKVAEVYVTDAVQALWLGDRVQASARMELDVDSHWLDVRFAVDGIDAAEVDAVLRSIVERRRYHRLRNGALVDLDTPAFEALLAAADDLALDAHALTDGRARVEAWRAAALDVDSASGDSVRLGRSLRSWLRSLRNPEELDLPVPAGLGGTLRAYQERGYQWLRTLARYGFGGILADDMGLGKTIQAIAFLLAEREAAPFAQPALVICPASLVYNWERELRAFGPSLRVAVVAGPSAEREASLARADEADVLVTSYPLVLRDLEHYRGRRLHALILDEAQFLKNHDSKTARAIRDLASDRRFALTGTPVENSLADLWSILRAVFPALAGSRDAFLRLSPEQVARRVRPFLLRRRKGDVLRELPEKIETVASAELTAEQKRVYLAYMARLREDASRDLDASGFQRSRIKILAGLTRLRQICCDPALFLEGYEGGSGKLDLLMDLLAEAIDGGRRILVFSQFTSMLAIIRDALAARGWPCFYLDGSTPTAQRLTLVEAFNRGERPVFLISLKAGGTGLNLTGADTVILYDLWWNPAVEQQAADRAHRIGQKRVVQVIRLIARGTIEEHIHTLQEAKRALVDAVVTDSDQGLGALGEADVRELLGMPAALHGDGN